MEKQKVWVSDPIEGFVMGRIVDIKVDEVIVQPLDSKKQPISCELDRAYPAEEYDSKDVDDNCRLNFWQKPAFYFYTIIMGNVY